MWRWLRCVLVFAVFGGLGCTRGGGDPTEAELMAVFEGRLGVLSHGFVVSVLALLRGGGHDDDASRAAAAGRPPSWHSLLFPEMDAASRGGCGWVVAFGGG